MTLNQSARWGLRVRRTPIQMSEDRENALRFMDDIVSASLDPRLWKRVTGLETWYRKQGCR